MNRLETVGLYDDTQTLIESSSITYNEIGNIESKLDVGTYNYGASGAGPHALTSVTNGPRLNDYHYDLNGNMDCRGDSTSACTGGDEIEWTSYDKPQKIHRGTDYAEFSYGANRSRYKQVAKVGTPTTTTHYIGTLYQKSITGSTDTHTHHIRAGNQTVAVYTRKDPVDDSLVYLHRDHLSSIVAATDDQGVLEQELSFDAWGKRRNSDWTADSNDSLYSANHETEYGFTGHESLDNVVLTHMNGRVQDPITGRMISADPTVPNPSNAQSFNRYSYVRNNPLSLVDPSGFRDEDPDDFTCTVCWSRNDDRGDFWWWLPYPDSFFMIGYEDYWRAGPAHRVDPNLDLGSNAYGWHGGIPCVFESGATRSQCDLERERLRGDIDNDEFLKRLRERGLAHAEGIFWGGVVLANAYIIAILGPEAAAILDILLSGGDPIPGPAGSRVKPGLGKMSNELPNNAPVCRGGQCKSKNFEEGRGVQVDADGNLQNVSVNTGADKSVQELTEGMPHPQVGVTTAGDIRNAGGDVVPDAVTNPRNPNHAKMGGITSSEAEKLFTPTIPNPNK